MLNIIVLVGLAYGQSGSRFYQRVSNSPRFRTFDKAISVPTDSSVGVEIPNN
jgi:hypothetical protein